MKFKATIIFEYEVDGDLTNSKNEECLFQQDPVQLAEMAEEDGNYTVTVEEIEYVKGSGE